MVKKMIYLSRNEELILLSIWRLKDNAYGVTIRRGVMKITGKMLHFGSMYNTLDLLMKKSLVFIEESKPTAKRGGRRKKLYFLTPEGKRALKEAQEIQQLAWRGIPEIVVEGE